MPISWLGSLTKSSIRVAQETLHHLKQNGKKAAALKKRKVRWWVSFFPKINSDLSLAKKRRRERLHSVIIEGPIKQAPFHLYPLSPPFHQNKEKFGSVGR